MFGKLGGVVAYEERSQMASQQQKTNKDSVRHPVFSDYFLIILD